MTARLASYGGTYLVASKFPSRIQTNSLAIQRPIRGACTPQREAIRVTTVLTAWATNAKTAGISCRPLPSIHVKAQQYEEHIYLLSYDSMARLNRG